MVEFESFVYLDVEKTGSAFISQMLKRFCSERAVRREHHAPMEGDVDRSKFYFISTRDPLDAYLSLYSYGCDSMGKLQNRLSRKEDGKLHEKFYDGTAEGFGNWLTFMLTPANAKLLGEGYDEAGEGAIAKRVGLQSYRYLRLALPNAAELLAPCKRQAQIYSVYAANKLPEYTVRHEHFADDLCELIAGRLRHAFSNIDGAVAHVRSALPVNASDRVDAYEANFRIRPRLRDRVREREWLLCDLYGY